MLSADIQSLESNNNGMSNTQFQSPSGTTIWAPTFYDPFQVKHRRRTSKKQFGVLEKAFNENPKPNAATRRDLAEKLKMTVRGVQVWFQNRRAKAKTQKLRMNGKKTTSSANSPSENENESNHGGNNSNNDSYNSDTNNGGHSINHRNSHSNSCSGSIHENNGDSGLREDDDQNDLLDIDGKLKTMDNKDYCSDSLITNSYFPVEEEPNQGLVQFSDSSSDYFFDKHDGLNQGMNSSQLHSDFYSNNQQMNMNRSRSRAKSLPNVFHLGMYMPQQQQAHLSNQINSQLNFQGMQPSQLSNQSSPYSLMGNGPKSSSNGNSATLSPQNLQFLQQKSFSPNTFSLYSQKSQLPSMNNSNDTSSASSPSLSVASGSEQGSSQARLPSTIVKHPDQIFSYNGLDNSGMNGNRNFVNYITSPGLNENGPNSHSNSNSNGSNNGYSPNSFQNFMPEVASIGGMRSIDESLGYLNGAYGTFAQQNINNPYQNIPNFVSELGSNNNVNVLQGVSPSYPNGFNPGRRSSCPPEFLASVNSLQLSAINEENGSKQKGLETINEDDGLE